VARKRPIVSDSPPSRPDEALRRKANGTLSRAQARALTRCAPLTKSEFRAQHELAENRVFPPTARLSEPVDEAPVRNSA
jgi:hypothetical protein